MATKAVRFSAEEEKEIQEFLKKNPFFDFSTLARIAILQFIKNPNLEITPIDSHKPKNKKSEQRVQ